MHARPCEIASLCNSLVRIGIITVSTYICNINAYGILCNIHAYGRGVADSALFCQALVEDLVSVVSHVRRTITRVRAAKVECIVTVYSFLRG